jgi:hypothetical protein
VFTHRTICTAVAAVAIGLLAAGCSSSDDDLTAPPTSTSVTEAFCGTLTLNGAKTHTFTVTASGGITAQLTDWMPDPNLQVGLSLGTWNGSLCQVVIDHPNATQGQVVAGQTNATGDFCVRIYDAFGTIVDPQTYTIAVSYQKANQ